MCDCNDSSPCGCKDLQVGIGPRGLQGPPGAPPVFTTAVTTLPAGSQATAVVTGTSPNLTINFGLPEGATGSAGQDGQDGTNGINSFTTLTASFTQPVYNAFATVLMDVAEVSWPVTNQTIYVQGIGDHRVLGRTPATPGYTGPGTLFLLQINNSQLTPTGTVAPIGSGVGPSGETGLTGADGQDGQDGATGASAYVPIVATHPVGIPAPGFETQAVNDTVGGLFYLTYWNGTTWVDGQDLHGARGSVIWQSVGVPVSIPGSVDGDWAIDTVNKVMYLLSGGFWNFQFSFSGGGGGGGGVLQTYRGAYTSSLTAAVPTVGYLNLTSGWSDVIWDPGATAAVQINASGEIVPLITSSKYSISAAVTLDTGVSRTQHVIRLLQYNGAVWVEICRSYLYTPNSSNDYVTLQVSADVAGSQKCKIQVSASAGAFVLPVLNTAGTNVLNVSTVA